MITIFKLYQGQDIIADVENYDDENILITNPLLIGCNPVSGNIQFSKWVPYVDDTEFMVPKDIIMIASNNVNIYMLQYYNSFVESIEKIENETVYDSSNGDSNVIRFTTHGGSDSFN